MRPAAPPAAPKYLSQAQTQSSPAPGDTAASAREAALKAEMEKRWGDAERIYRGLLAAEPNRVELLLRLVDVLAVQKKPVEAAETLARAADLRPDDGELQLHASEAFGAANKPADALRYADRALALHPTDQALHRRRAQLATWAGDNAQAIESLKFLIDANPADAALKRDLARVLGLEGHLDEAAKVLSEYVAQNPKDKDVLIEMAHTRATQGDLDAALDLLDRYRDAGGDPATYSRERSELLAHPAAALKAEGEKRWGDAERIYRELLAKEPDRVDLLLRLVDVLAIQKKRVEAAETLARAADLRPGDGDLQLHASEAFGAADRPADAMRYVERALAIRPTDQALQRRRAELATWSGNYAEVEKSLRALIEANPSDVTLKRDLGRVLLRQHRLVEAEKLVSEYAAQYPKDPNALLDLAHIAAARGDTKGAAGLLTRYRNAGGDEATYRRERAQVVAPPPRAARPSPAPQAGAPPAGVPQAGVPQAGVPPAVLKAEGEKRWGEAERLLRALIAREPNRVDLWLRLVDDLAVQKKPAEAAQALAQAADLRPQDAELQLHASEAFGAANQPADALRYVDRALALRPTDMALHRRRAQVAVWAGDNAQAEESLRALVAADPGDPTLKRDLGQVLGWRGYLDEAAGLLSDYVAERPRDKDGLLYFARVQSGRGNSDAAVELLKRYREEGGDESTYHHELSLMLAWGGRPRSALALAEPGLASDPSDFQYRFARASALSQGYQYASALSDVDRLAQLRPNAPELVDLRRSIEVNQRPYLQLDAGARWESDNIDAQSNEISYHQPLNDTWWVFAGGGGDYLSSISGSGLAPIQGGTFMARGFGYVGAQARLDYGTIASARIGATGNGRGSATTWQLTADSKLSDDLRLQVVNMRDYQIVSPRSLSLGITRIDTGVQLTYTPDLLWTMVAVGKEAEFSDGNHLWNATLAPRRAVVRTQYWNIDLGVSGNWYGYTLRPPPSVITNGYYAPSFYQNYTANAYVFYKMNQEDGISLILSLGAQKDETFRNFKMTNDFSTEATFGLLSDWMLKLRAAYTNHSTTGPSFSAESVGMTLVRRF